MKEKRREKYPLNVERYEIYEIYMKLIFKKININNWLHMQERWQEVSSSQR